MKRLRFHSKDQKAMFWVNLGMAILPPLMAVFEATQIPPSKVFFFLLFRLVFALLFLVLTFKMYFNPRNHWYLACVGIAQILFVIHGQCFLPLYFTFLVHLTLIYGLIYTPPARIFWPVTSVGYVTFAFLFIRQWEEFIVAITQISLGEYFFVLVAGFVVTAAAYVFYSRHRHVLERSALTFGLVGQKTSFVLHDLKNRMMGPVIYVDLLKEHIANFPDERLHKVVDGLAADLTKLREGIQHLQFSHMLLNEAPQEFSMRETLQRLSDYLQARHSHIDMQIQGDYRVVGPRALVDSIFLNLIINSIENFKYQGIEKPQIHVDINGKCLVYRDNGKGFSSSHSELGLFVIKEAARKLGARVQFSNDQQGVRIEMHL